MKKIIYCLFFILPMATMAQTLAPTQADIASTNMDKLTPSSTLATYDMSEKDIKGSPYFSQEYQEGELWTTKDTHYGSELLYRFDGIENSVQIKYKDSGKEVLLLPSNIKRLDLKINGQVTTFVRVPAVDKANAERLYQVIYLSNNAKVVKLFKKKLLHTTTESQGFDPTVNQIEYKDLSTYYINVGLRNNDYTQFSPTQKGLIKAFPDKETKIKQVLASGKYKKNLTDVTMGEVLKLLEDMTGKN